MELANRLIELQDRQQDPFERLKQVMELGHNPHLPISLVKNKELFLKAQEVSKVRDWFQHF